MNPVPYPCGLSSQFDWNLVAGEPYSFGSVEEVSKVEIIPVECEDERVIV